MNVQELLNIVREYPMDAEVLFDGDELTPAHVQVVDNAVNFGVPVVDDPATPEVESPKRKRKAA